MPQDGQQWRGQAAVEAALVIPVLLFLLMGMFVVGHWLTATQVAVAAAREGARTGALTGNRCAALAAAAGVMGAIGTKGLVVEMPNPLPSVGSALTVTVTYPIALGFDFFSSSYAASATSAYPFGRAIGTAAARMEVDPVVALPAC